ncbi:MAG: glycoside hydrolase family 3 C-terminal domain-containing protein [Ktedonobacteraceae bacterium]|nr:glycoside hydrolase family 3 C-terminal domain-containing protein [Ktedonobacteraceae bacterium]
MQNREHLIGAEAATDLADGISLDQQIGQVISVGFEGTTPSSEVIELIQKYHVGSVILFTRNVQNPQQVRELTYHLQMAAREAGHRFPLLISIDQENGVVSRLGEEMTVFPGNMAQGAINSEEITYKIAQATGRELRAMGITMNLAPVADVNNNPANPVIGVRSFGEDPQQVARLVTAAVQGHQSAGIISTLKHFPGHGDTTVDSHLALPVIPYDLERLESIELPPFKAGIAAGAESVMIAHQYLPRLMSQQNLPATISPEIVRHLLRERLGFTGVITSDCMEMQAVTRTIGTERASVMALQAGIDQVLISHHYARQQGSITAIKNALATGELLPAIVQQAAERILRLKARLLRWEDVHPTINTAVIRCEAHQQLSRQAYARSTTLIKNDEGRIPLRLTPEQRLLLVMAQPRSQTRVIDRAIPFRAMSQATQQRHAALSVFPLAADPSQDELRQLEQVATESDAIIVVTVNAYLHQEQGAMVRRLQETGRLLIVVAAYDPYDLLAFPQVRTCLATYEFTAPALEAAVRVIFGEAQAQGRLPITLASENSHPC